jgi:hypothetical protein
LSRIDPRSGDAGRGELRLLCDEMLKGIGRWLRAAGYDVAIAEDGAHDDDLLAHARAESRLLLTCDRRLAARAGADPAIAVLATESLDEAARELSARFGIDWLHAPFTRCLVDNARLTPAAQEEVPGLPVTVRQGPARACPAAMPPRLLAGQSRTAHARPAGALAGAGATRRPLTRVGIPLADRLFTRISGGSRIALLRDSILRRLLVKTAQSDIRARSLRIDTLLG